MVYLNTLYRFFTILHAHLLSIRKYYKDLFVKYKKNIRLVFLVTFLATKLFNISMGVSSKIWWKMVENISHHFKSFVFKVDPPTKILHIHLRKLSLNTFNVRLIIPWRKFLEGDDNDRSSSEGFHKRRFFEDKSSDIIPFELCFLHTD